MWCRERLWLLLLELTGRHECSLPGTHERIAVVAEVLPVDLHFGVEAAYVLLDVGVSISVTVLRRVGGVVRVQTVFRLPPVRYSVAVRVFVRVALVFGITADLFHI